MHGDQQVSTKNLARAIGAKSGRARASPRSAERAQRLPGRRHVAVRARSKAMPVYVEADRCSALDRICINGGRRGYLIGIAPRVLTEAARARARCACA